MLVIFVLTNNGLQTLVTPAVSIDSALSLSEETFAEGGRSKGQA